MGMPRIAVMLSKNHPAQLAWYANGSDIGEFCSAYLTAYAASRKIVVSECHLAEERCQTSQRLGDSSSSSAWRHGEVLMLSTRRQKLFCGGTRATRKFVYSNKQYTA